MNKPNISDICLEIQEKLNKNFGIGTMTVAHNCNDTIYVYEHVRGFAKLRTPFVIPGIEHFKVVRKYVGKFTL